MDDPFAEGLAILLVVFSGVLVGLAIVAFQRFGERRFLLVAAGFGAITVAAALSAVSEMYDIFDETFSIGAAPLLLLVLAAALLYLAMIGTRSPPGRPGNG